MFFLLMHFQQRMTMFAFFGFSFFIVPLFGAESAAVSEKCISETLLDVKNRDEVEPTFLLINDDLRIKPSNIVKAHEILRDGLQQYLGFRGEDLGFYLNHILVKKPPLKDEYGQEIRSYFKVFKFIWDQYNETLCQNYAIKQYDKDKLDLCSVARFLSHQSAVGDRRTIMNRMGDALGYKCHPCTPYKRKEHGETLVPNTDDISSIESLSPEQILALCKDYDHQGKQLAALSTAPPSTTSTFTTTPATIATRSTKITTDTKAPEIITTFGPALPSLDYSPSCSYSNGDVFCNKVPLLKVQKQFRGSILPRLASAHMILQPYVYSETFIPEDVFGTKRILHILIEYPDSRSDSSCCDTKLQVDADAFRSTRSYTNKFDINMIDCTLLDFGFLSGFDRLAELTLTNTHNIQHCLPSLPPLPRLTALRFDYCFGMNLLNVFPTLTNGLKDFKLTGGVNYIDAMYNDETVNRILDWLLLSSAQTLEIMAIIELNQVTRVPHKIAAFKALNKLWLHDNNISTIESGAFSFSVPVSLLSIRGNGIKEIEPGAFQGDFKDAQIWVYDNNLTQFEESVFGPILQQMASGKGGIGASFGNGNPIDCSKESICHLAWLRRYEAAVKFGLKCSDGTLFEHLQPAGFNHCPL